MSNIDFSAVKSVTIPDGNVKKIEIDGVKVWEKATEPINYLDGVEWTDGYAISANGTISKNNPFRYNTNCVVVPAGTYMFKIEAGYSAALNFNMRIHRYSSGDNWIEQVAMFNTTTADSVTFNVADNANYIRVSVAKDSKLEYSLRKIA